MAITISGENNNDRILASDGVIDEISGINIVGLLTAGHINVGSNIQLGNAGIVTATTFIGNLTGNVNSTSPLLLQTGGSERFRITGNNELGIAGANYGSSGQVLTSGGSGSAVSWTTIAAQANISNNADNRVITGGSGVNLNGEANFTYNGTQVDIAGTTDGVLNLDTTDSRGAFIRFGQGGSYHNMVGCADGLVTGLDKQDLAVRATDNFAIATNGDNERFRISSAGLVSIPVSGSLQVGAAGSGETDTKVYVANTGGNAYIQLKGADSSGTVGLKFGRNSVANRAGIDWSASTDALVFRTGGTGERLLINSSGDYLFLGGTLRIKNSANDAQYGAIYGDSTSFHVNAGGNLKLYSGGGERVRFSNDGQISIQGTNTAFDTTGQLNSLQLYYEQDSGQASIGPYSSGGNTHLSFYTNAGGAAATEKLRITGGGQVNIGDNLTQTTYPFHIQGSTNTTARIKCSGNDTANFFFDSNRSGASSNIGLLRGLWNGTSVADIRFLTGVDTSNKDDGKIAFLTASAGTPSFRMIIDQEGTTHFSDNDVRTDIADVVNVKLYNPARFVARNGKHVERGFYSMSTGSGSVDYAHMKTDMATNSSTMFLFTCRGYSYGSGKVMFAQTCGYCYSSTNSIINTENRSWDGQTVLSTYKSSDGYVALQVDFGSNSSYYTGFVIDVQYANHAMGAMNYKVISATFNSNNNHFS